MFSFAEVWSSSKALLLKFSTLILFFSQQYIFLVLSSYKIFTTDHACLTFSVSSVCADTAYLTFLMTCSRVFVDGNVEK